jgi:hypothetical protein
VVSLRLGTMKRKGRGEHKLERNFWIVVGAFTLLAVILILIEGHYWNFQ